MANRIVKQSISADLLVTDDGISSVPELVLDATRVRGQRTVIIPDSDTTLGTYRVGVVDIYPHSNTGPGDTARGILDWSNHDILIVAPPASDQLLLPVSFSVQPSKGTIDYVDPNPFGQQLGLCWGPATNARGIFDTFITDALVGNAGTNPFIPYVWGVGASTSRGTYVNASFGNPLSTIKGLGLYFGDDNGPQLELTSGNGSVRITVGYMIIGVLS
jgi:hypothetical protein